MKTKPVILVLAVLALIIAGVAVDLFLIGEPVDGAQVYCTAEEADGILTLTVSTPESGVAFRGWKVRRDGGTVSVSLGKVQVSPFYSSGVEKLDIELEDAKEVYFGGKLVWEAEP